MAARNYILHNMRPSPAGKYDHFTQATLGPERDVGAMGLRGAVPHSQKPGSMSPPPTLGSPQAFRGVTDPGRTV